MSKKKTKEKAEKAPNSSVSTLVVVSDSYLFFVKCKCRVVESRTQQHHKYAYDEYL